MPRISGIDLLKSIKQKNSTVPVIMITGHPSIENAVRTMRYGALNYYVKPLDLAEIIKEIKQILTTRNEQRLNESNIPHNIITKNTVMKNILKEILKAAPTSAPVIITGESGTGKELIANYLHNQSLRKNKSFIKVNCAAIPETLLETELFGHEKGAFTDAVKEHIGKFELANNGTLFLDEIGDMSLKTQAKILRVLQEKALQRVGGMKVIKTDIRIISATNKDFKQLIANKEFREDLFYRLSVITIDLPSLKDRPDDIILLAKYFISNYNDVYNKKIKDISNEVKQIFSSHNWPGNVRELKNCIERAVIFCDMETIEINDLPSQYKEICNEYSENSYEKAFKNFDKKMILDALEKSNGIKKEAAKLLNIHAKTLYYRMKKLGLNDNKKAQTYSSNEKYPC